jgi:phosphopantetheine adenylyltransferase
MASYRKPFDNRLRVLVQDGTNADTMKPIMPVSGPAGHDVYTFLMPLETLKEKRPKLEGKQHFLIRKFKENEEKAITTFHEEIDIKDKGKRWVKREWNNGVLKRTEYTLDNKDNSYIKYEGNEDAEREYQDMKSDYLTALDIYNQQLKNQEKEIEKAKRNPANFLQHSIMNPYAMLHLTGGIENGSFDSSNNKFNGETTLIDNGGKPWYERKLLKNDDALNGYSKVPTTSALIEWGKQDAQFRTPYLFQDFVFCKWWNKIPNNRLITLRRFPNPVLDNLKNSADDLADENGIPLKALAFPPMATAITYFGDDTGNNLKDILKFSTGYKWGETKADIWDLHTTITPPSTNEQLAGAFNSVGIAYGGTLAKALNFMSVWNGKFNPEAAIEEKNGLPPDPYKDGPYTNRIQGPVNRIDTVKKREPGLNFKMDGLKIKFNYIARPIGGINSKAIMLDILSNFMVMGSASAVFFGGAHRNRIPGRRFPGSENDVVRQLQKGNLLGKDGAIATFSGGISDFFSDNGGAGGIFSTMFNAAKGILSDLLNALGNPFGLKLDSPDEISKDDSDEVKKAKESKNAQVKNNLTKAITSKMQAGMAIPYVTGMRALLLGEPVGDWHLTIGNPMNPIAMIGNLICTNIEVEIDEEAGLGPDDFPLGWTITVSLDHGMIRDRDSIESMFNLGNGRIYELPDHFKSSADFETKVDDQTGNNISEDVENIRKVVTTQTNEKGRVVNNKMVNKDQDKLKIISINLDNLEARGFDEIDNLTNRLPKIIITKQNSQKSNS